MGESSVRDEELNDILEQTFPASDPPAFMAGVAIVGRPYAERGRPPEDRFGKYDGNGTEKTSQQATQIGHRLLD
jgi:hypothetical protein